ncbi:unnamed protein product [Protopolystoma xenopodis]|uniref:Uncharacterized protein n=1 Tax=Protopolystoma xenopodis TaxID=117903 RepID=A0A3S5FGB7_9PLAT|nr:unnamed protein product [Protopolystoma xenopodis]
MASKTAFAVNHGQSSSLACPNLQLGVHIPLSSKHSGNIAPDSQDLIGECDSSFKILNCRSPQQQRPFPECSTLRGNSNMSETDVIGLSQTEIQLASCHRILPDQTVMMYEAAKVGISAKGVESGNDRLCISEDRIGEAALDGDQELDGAAGYSQRSNSLLNHPALASPKSRVIHDHSLRSRRVSATSKETSKKSYSKDIAGLSVDDGLICREDNEQETREEKAVEGCEEVRKEQKANLPKSGGEQGLVAEAVLEPADAVTCGQDYNTLSGFRRWGGLSFRVGLTTQMRKRAYAYTAALGSVTSSAKGEGYIHGRALSSTLRPKFSGTPSLSLSEMLPASEVPGSPVGRLGHLNYVNSVYKVPAASSSTAAAAACWKQKLLTSVLTGRSPLPYIKQEQSSSVLNQTYGRHLIRNRVHNRPQQISNPSYTGSNEGSAFFEAAKILRSEAADMSTAAAAARETLKALTIKDRREILCNYFTTLQLLISIVNALGCHHGHRDAPSILHASSGSSLSSAEECDEAGVWPLRGSDTESAVIGPRNAESTLKSGLDVSSPTTVRQLNRTQPSEANFCTGTLTTNQRLHLLRHQTHDCFLYLYRLSPGQFRWFCLGYIASQPVSDIVEMLHSLTSFCLDPATHSPSRLGKGSK